MEHFDLKLRSKFEYFSECKNICPHLPAASWEEFVTNLLRTTVVIHLFAQSREEGGFPEEKEDPDVVLVKVEKLEEAEPTSSLSIQEGEWNAAGLPY